VEGASATAANTKCDIKPDSITLSGDPETLEDLNQITLGTINLNSFSSTFSDDYAIPLPNDVENMSGITSANVSLQIFGTATKRLSANNIQYRNAPEGRGVVVITQSLDVTVRGSVATLDAVTADNIAITVDLAELSNNTGTFMLEAKVRIDGFNNVDAIGTYNVTIQITDQVIVPEPEPEPGTETDETVLP
jgi:hypothetical protein